MIRKATAMLSLCCLVLCGIVGYLSHQELQKSSKLKTDEREATCREVLESIPDSIQRLYLQQFAPGKHWATFDVNQDGNWEYVCLPVFPSDVKLNISHGYRGIIVCFEDVQTKEELLAILDSKPLNTTFWPGRQKLTDAAYSKLAMDYKRLDIERSPIVHVGVKNSNPVLGKESLKISKTAGMVFGGVFGLSLLSLCFNFKKRIRPDSDDAPLVDPRANRAGLPPLRQKTPSSTFLN